MDYKLLQQEIVSTARKYVGIKEVKGNMGWKSENLPNLAEYLEKAMKEHGFSYGQAWCAYFGEHIWAEVYDKVGLAREIDKYFSGSARRTLKKFSNADGWQTGQVPLVGAIAVWKRVRNGEDTSQGHVGIVVEVHDDYMITVEGNTNAAGSREGDQVAEKRRKYNFNTHHGLALEGFVYPKGISPEVIFKNKAEGDEFRAWVNDFHSEYAKEIDLDRAGSHTNSFIMKAWDKLGNKYKDRK
jgi:surface antigen